MDLLTHAHVFAPESLGKKHLLIAGGVIVWIGDEIPEIPETLGVREHDLSGCALIPGLIDGHAHVTGGGGESGFKSRVPAPVLSRYTSAGVTTAVGVLGTDDTTRDTASLLAQTRALCEEGMTAFCHTGGYHVPPVTLTGSVRGDIVHLDRIIGIGELALSDHRSSQPTLDELLRIASDAHVAGVMTGKAGIVHLHLGDGPRGLELVREALEVSELPARVFNPTHVNRRKALFEEAMVLAREGCTIDVTAFPVSSDEDAWPAEDAIARYLQAGLPPERITASSDGGGCLPVFDADGVLTRMGIGDPSRLMEMIRRLLTKGFRLEEVLPTVTSNVARLLRLDDKGRLATGCDADLVVLDRDHEIRDVMCHGVWHIQNSSVVVKGYFEGDNFESDKAQ